VNGVTVIPRTRVSTQHLVLLCCLLIFVEIVVRSVFLSSTTNDTRSWVLPWYQRLVTAGYSALGGQFPTPPGREGGVYTPPYYYLLFVASLFDGLLSPLTLIKTISIVFDFIAGLFAYLFTRLYASNSRALIAAAAVTLAPTDIANGSWWGQCDVIWAALILGSLYFTALGRPFAATTAFGIAISVKLQAVFFAPFLLMLFFNGELRLRHFAWIPAAYGLMMLPAVWLGRPVSDVLTVYFDQATLYRRLSMNAPNLYWFIPNEYYNPVAAIGVVGAAIIAGGLAYLPRLTGVKSDATFRALAATTFLALCPFLLPKMHDRYFFGADICSIVLVALEPSLLLVAVMFQVTSLLAYVPIITYNVLGYRLTSVMAMAALMSTVTVGFLVFLYCYLCMRSSVSFPRLARQFAKIAVTLCGAFVLWSGIKLIVGTLPLDLWLATREQWLLFAALILLTYVILHYLLRCIPIVADYARNCVRSPSSHR
jgi:Gpi18-like mannosyltransferase